MNWRLILDEPASGAWNMAVDEALLLSQKPNDAPVLRFYGWNPPCVSLGRFQNAAAFHSQFSIPNSQFVRRPTGGRAIWHQHEITYAVVLREELLPREWHSIIGSYQWLSRAFIEGLQTLGVQAQLAQNHKSLPREENCFASAARSDFVVDGRKLIGAAQCRKKGAILQHGSLLLSVDRTAWQQNIGGSMEATVSLQELGIQATRDEIIAALCSGAKQTLDAHLQVSGLSKNEKQQASRLYSQKYTLSEWNFTGHEP